MGELTVVIGGARSGKSRYAERYAASLAGPRVYVATAEPFDDEMRIRIEKHRKDRKGIFDMTIEESLDPAVAMGRVPEGTGVVLFDCMTVWMGNLLHHRGMRDTYEEIDRFLSALDRRACDIVVVTNEVGQGIVPGDGMSRHFRDHAGWLNQDLTRLADRVVWMVAGIPVVIKGNAPQ